MLSSFIHKIFCVASFSKLQLEQNFVLHYVAKIKELAKSMTRRRFYRNVNHISSIASSSFWKKQMFYLLFDALSIWSKEVLQRVREEVEAR